MENENRQGVGWAAVTALSGIIAVLIPHPIPKLVALSASIVTGTMAVDCFSSSAEAAYQQLATRREYRQLLAHVYSVSRAKLVRA